MTKMRCAKMKEVQVGIAVDQISTTKWSVSFAHLTKGPNILGSCILGSFMLKHQEREHNGAEGVYTAKVPGSDRDCLTRQVREAVRIRSSRIFQLRSVICLVPFLGTAAPLV